MEISEGLFVTLDFTLTDPSGKILESTAGKEPISFVFGSRNILPGLAKVLGGMKAGESKKGTIAAGQLVPRELGAKRQVARPELPPGAQPKVGDRFAAKDVGHAQPVQLEVTAVSPQGVDVVLLHPLNDVEVAYDVTVRSVRRPNVPPPPPMSVDEDLTDAVLEEIDG